MLQLTPQIAIREDELEWHAMRASGPGGQNVNKVSSALHLRFDIHASSLPEAVKHRLLAMRDQRISSDGVLVIKAQRHRTRAKNREDALDRLRELLLAASRVQRERRPTQPTRGAQQRRLERKTQRGRLKQLRRSLDD